MSKLKRSSNKVFGGVLGGIANYFDIDPVWVRLGYVLLALINFGTALILYIIALIIMPESDSVFDTEESNTRKVIRDNVTDRKSLTLIGLVLVLLGLVFLFEQIYNIDLWNNIRHYMYTIKNYLWPLLLIGVGAWIIYRGRR